MILIFLKLKIIILKKLSTFLILVLLFIVSFVGFPDYHLLWLSVLKGDVFSVFNFIDSQRDCLFRNYTFFRTEFFNVVSTLFNNILLCSFLLLKVLLSFRLNQLKHSGLQLFLYTTFLIILRLFFSKRILLNLRNSCFSVNKRFVFLSKTQ